MNGHQTVNRFATAVKTWTWTRRVVKGLDQHDRKIPSATLRTTEAMRLSRLFPVILYPDSFYCAAAGMTKAEKEAGLFQHEEKKIAYGGGARQRTGKG